MFAATQLKFRNTGHVSIELFFNDKLLNFKSLAYCLIFTLKSYFFLDLEPPKNLRVKSRDENALRLQWDPAPGDFENYGISCEGEKYNCSRPFIQVGKDKREEVFITDLTPGALYNFAVEALQTGIRSEKAKLSTRTCKLLDY